MAFAIALMIISTMLVCCTNIIVVSAWDEPAEEIHVVGKVLCQDCTKGYNEWVTGSKPIKGAKVLLTCMDKRNRIVYSTSDTTDELGHYDIKVNKYVYHREFDIKGCYVRLVSSPDNVCNILTNFGGGKSGVKLDEPTSIYRGLIKYMVNKFYYTTPMCDMPETDTYDSESKDPKGQREGQEQGGYY